MAFDRYEELQISMLELVRLCHELVKEPKSKEIKDHILDQLKRLVQLSDTLDKKIKEDIKMLKKETAKFLEGKREELPLSLRQLALKLKNEAREL